MEFIRSTVSNIEERLHIRLSGSDDGDSPTTATDKRASGSTGRRKEDVLNYSNHGSASRHSDSSSSSDDNEGDCMLCSFALTGLNSAYQSIYQCVTCMEVQQAGGEGGMGSNECCCIGCADACHAGHEVRYVGFGMGYCDCGAKGCAWLASSDAKVEQEVAAQEASLNLSLSSCAITAPATSTTTTSTATTTADASATTNSTLGRRNLQVHHDTHGRLACTEGTGISIAPFKEFDWGDMTDELASALEAQAASLVTHSKETFWLGAQAEPRCALEAAAKCVFEHYTRGLVPAQPPKQQQQGKKGATSSSSSTTTASSPLPPYDPALSGAEWWVQVKPLEPAATHHHTHHHSSTNATSAGASSGSSADKASAYVANVEAVDSSRHGGSSSKFGDAHHHYHDTSAMQAAAIDLHYDKDEWIAEHFGIGVYPQISTVTYLTDARSAGTHSADTGFAYALPSPTVVFSNKAWDEVGGPITDVYISRPRRGKHICFDGSYLHGAPSHPLLKQDPYAEIDDEEDGGGIDSSTSDIGAGVGGGCSSCIRDGATSTSTSTSDDDDDSDDEVRSLDVQQHASRSAAYAKSAKGTSSTSTSTTTSTSVGDATTTAPAAAATVPASRYRVTFLVNVWLGHRPVSVHPLPVDILAALLLPKVDTDGSGSSSGGGSGGSAISAISSTSMEEVEEAPVARIVASRRTINGKSKSSSSSTSTSTSTSSKKASTTSAKGKGTKGTTTSTSKVAVGVPTPRGKVDETSVVSTYVYDDDLTSSSASTNTSSGTSGKGISTSTGVPLWLRLPFVSSDSTWGQQTYSSSSGGTTTSSIKHNKAYDYDDDEEEVEEEEEDADITLRMYIPHALVYGEDSVLVNEDTCHLVYATEEVQYYDHYSGNGISGISGGSGSGSGGREVEEEDAEENSEKIPLRRGNHSHHNSSSSSGQAQLSPLVSLVYEYSGNNSNSNNYDEDEVPVDVLE